MGRTITRALGAAALAATMLLGPGAPGALAADGRLEVDVTYVDPDTGRVTDAPSPVIELYDADTYRLVTTATGTARSNPRATVAPGRYIVTAYNGDEEFLVEAFAETYRDTPLLEFDEATVVSVTSGGTARIRMQLDPLYTDMFDTRFTDDITFMRDAGITDGCGDNRYCPGDTVTRGQMAAFLTRALNLPAAPSAGFRDARGTRFESDIDRIAAVGITRSCNPRDGGTLYCPGRAVTRGQMAAFIARAFDLPTDVPDPGFRDDDGIFAQPIARLAASGITSGCNPSGANDRFCPDERVTRGQMAAFMNRAFQYVVRTNRGAGPAIAPRQTSPVG